MRRALAAIVLLLLLAPEASAQGSAEQTAQMVLAQAAIAAQASFGTSYLLALYMTQLAAAGSAPSQADIDEAARQYFTNGAAVTSVPGSGPGAAYFRNGAAVTAIPSSGPGAAYFHNGAEVMAYYPAQQATLAPVAAGEAGAALAGSESYEEDAGAQRAAANTAEAAPTGTAAAPAAPPSEVRLEASMATGLTCSPLEIEAAVAIASQFAPVSASPSPATSCTQSTTSTFVPPPAETPPDSVAAPAPNCPPRPSLLSRIAPALGGVLFGGLVVALWVRPRPLRVAQRRKARS